MDNRIWITNRTARIPSHSSTNLSSTNYSSTNYFDIDSSADGKSATLTKGETAQPPTGTYTDCQANLKVIKDGTEYHTLELPIAKVIVS